MNPRALSRHGRLATLAVAAWLGVASLVEVSRLPGPGQGSATTPWAPATRGLVDAADDESGAVPMFRGDPARSGQMPSPGPEGRPGSAGASRLAG
jgi:hypothetical protein